MDIGIRLVGHTLLIMKQVNLRLTDRHKLIAIRYSKFAGDCPRPDCGSVSHGIRKSLDAAEREMDEAEKEIKDNGNKSQY